MSHHNRRIFRRRPARPFTAHAATTSPLARAMFSLLLLAAIAVLSLPPARAVSDSFGWVPFWLLALPASAWLALQLPRRGVPKAQVPMRPGHPRRAASPGARRRLFAGQPSARSASAA